MKIGLWSSLFTSCPGNSGSGGGGGGGCLKDTGGCAARGLKVKDCLLRESKATVLFSFLLWFASLCSKLSGLHAEAGRQGSERTRATPGNSNGLWLLRNRVHVLLAICSVELVFVLRALGVDKCKQSIGGEKVFVCGVYLFVFWRFFQLKLEVNQLNRLLRLNVWKTKFGFSQSSFNIGKAVWFFFPRVALFSSWFHIVINAADCGIVVFPNVTVCSTHRVTLSNVKSIGVHCYQYPCSSNHLRPFYWNIWLALMNV